MDASQEQVTNISRVAAEMTELIVSPVYAFNVVLAPGFKRVGQICREAALWIPYSGELEFRLDSSRQPIRCRPGDVAFLPAPIFGRINLLGTKEARVSTVHFYPSIMGSWQTFVHLGFPFYCKGNQDTPWYQSGHYLGELFAAKPNAWRLEMSAIISSILFYILRKYGDQFHPSKLRAGSPAWARIRPALKAMDEGFRNASFSVADMAGAAGLGASRFRQVFRLATTMSPARQLRQRRVDEAKRYLLASDLRCSEIAGKCGFSDTAYFFRTFKQLTKKTPLDYRRNPS